MISPVSVSKSFDSINTGGVTPVAFVIHAIAEQEAVFHMQAGKVGLQAGLCLTIMILVDQYCSQDFAGAVGQAIVADGAQCGAFVQNVVNDQHGAAYHVGFRAQSPLQNAAGGFLPVTSGMQILGLNRELESWQQLASQDQTAIHDAE